MNFEQIYEEFFKVIYTYITMRVRDDAAAQDIAASMWQKVLRKLNTFNKDKGTVRQWLFGIARNEVNMHHRLYYVRKVFSLTGFEDAVPADQKTADQQLAEEEEKKLLLSAMGTLGGRERDILSLKFYSGLNNREIAGLLNITETNAGTIINRSIDKLRVLLEAK